MKKIKYKCAKCDYPAANETIFRELESPFAESQNCPKCGSSEILPEERYCYRWGWEIMKESGVDEKIREIEGTYIKLTHIGEKQPEGTMRYEDLPEDIAKEFDEKSDEIKKIIQDSDVLNKLAKAGVGINYNITVFRSK